MLNNSFVSVGLSQLLPTIFCVNSWFFIYDPYFPKPYASNCWTINTLWFFYLVFPLLLPRIQALSDIAISRLLVILFYVQFLALLYYSYYVNVSFQWTDKNTSFPEKTETRQ